MNLYLKYRPRTIEELDLTSVRESLTQAIQANKMAHAYLFTGPRGAGKTSAARILARVVNCHENEKTLAEPCNKCDECRGILAGSAVDVIEIDAASNRGIDDVRDLKEKIGLSPAQLRKKVYIIDEVHMMTAEAFNALLKTLEEPPKHALFILCTTEAHKVPETIKSRCSRVLFTKAGKDEMLRSLSRVVKGEKAKISREALELLASSVDGSFRDGVKVLDQVLAEGKEVELAQMERVLTGASGYQAKELAAALVARELEGALDAFRTGVAQGVDLTHVIVSLIEELRESVVAGQVELVELIYQLDETARKLSTSPVPEILVEMAIIGWCTSDENSKLKISESANQLVRESASQLVGESANQQVSKAGVREYGGSSQELWEEMSKSMNGGSYSLGALLAKARPGILQGDLLTIEVAYDFHREQIMLEKHRLQIEEFLSQIVGSPMRVGCEVVLQRGEEVDTMTEVAPEEETLLEAAEAIFTS